MTIHIPISELNKEIRTLYLEKKLKHLSIDYAPNSIVSFIDNEEVTVYDFTPILRLDNRFCGYNIYENYTEIIVELIVNKTIEVSTPIYI